MTTDLGANSTPAIISYVIMTHFGLAAIGVFLIIFFDVKLDALQAGVLGTVLGATGTGYAAVQGFWIGSSSAAKTAAAAMAESNKTAQGVVAQLAGSGPQPPSVPDVSPPEEKK